MLLFLYGADGYRSHQKLLALKRKYIDASLGDTNLAHLDVSQVSLDELSNSLLALPFLAKTRLVILDRLLSTGPKAIQDRFLDLLDRLPDTTVAVVYEPGVPDRRTILYKTVLKQATTQEFRPLTGRALETWMRTELQPLGVGIESAAANLLVRRTNGDSWRLALELQKLGMAATARAVSLIDPQLVTEFVRDAETTELFGIGDALAAGHPEQLLTSLHRLIRQGESPQLLLALLASTLRTLALVRDALDRGQSVASSIAHQTGLKAFVVQKHLAAARRFSLEQLTDLTASLAWLDLDSKRGKIDSEIGLELWLLRALA